jgi:hypothetical protein
MGEDLLDPDDNPKCRDLAHGVFATRRDRRGTKSAVWLGILENFSNQRGSVREVSDRFPSTSAGSGLRVRVGSGVAENLDSIRLPDEGTGLASSEDSCVCRMSNGDHGLIRPTLFSSN